MGPRAPGELEAGGAGSPVHTGEPGGEGAPAFQGHPELQAAQGRGAGTPGSPTLPWGLIPWWMCQEWKRWENQENSRHTSFPGSDHAIQHPHKGFPSSADLWSEAVGQELGTLRKLPSSGLPNIPASPRGAF